MSKLRLRAGRGPALFGLTYKRRGRIMPEYPIWAEIDLKAVAHNCRKVKELAKGSDFMAVVKANAYGHGALEVAQTALKNGAKSLAVARLDEGIFLRRSGFSEDVLVFGYTPEDRVEELLENDLVQTIFDLSFAKTYSNALQNLKKSLKVQLKLDTGMGRLGLLAVPKANSGQDFRNEVLKEIEEVLSLPGLEFQGAYTHLAQADDLDSEYTQEQLNCFEKTMNALQERGIRFPLVHAANSAAVISHPRAHLDLVRPGLMLYGLYPNRERMEDKVQLKPAMTLKTRIAQIKKVAPGFKISYGSSFVTKKESKIATLAVGYADGYPRIFSSCGEMLVQGQRAKVVGRVCMDQTMLDISHLESVQIGEEVVIFGRQKKEEISADELAAKLGTINYEVVSSIMQRVPLVHFE